jgi:hypothetical protein
MRASEIMAAISTDQNWTMTPDASQPTVIPGKPPIDPAKVVVEEKSGDWTISTDPSAPGGWAPPQKLQHPELPPAEPSTGNPSHAVASDRSIVAAAWEEKPTGIGQPLVEIDPSLIEAAKTADPNAPPAVIVSPIPPQAAMPPQAGPRTPKPPLLPATSPDVHVASSARPRMDLTDGNTGFFKDSEQLPRVSSWATGELAAMDKSKRKRTLIIVMSAALAAVVGFVVVILIVGGGQKPAQGASSSTVVERTPPTSGSGSGGGSVVTVVAPPKPVSIPVDAALAPEPRCAVEITTNPPGAEVALDKTNVIGTTPGTFELPCGVETKLYIRKAKYVGLIRAVTATSEPQPILLKLSLATFSVKVTSQPSGATITVGGKPMGVTPTTIKLPALATSTVTVTKDGFMPDIQKIAVKQNNLAHHVILKKKGR